MSICLPAGLECFENITVDKTQCINQCFGLFADIEHLDHLNIHQTEFGSDIFADLEEEYKAYKRGWMKDIEYPQEILGKDFILTSYKTIIYYLLCRL